MKIRINRLEYDLAVPASRRLLDLLREDLNLTGTKRGCDDGSCGACTVLVNGEPRLSCLTLARLMEGRSVTTIEGVGSPDHLHPVQKAFIERGALQCGFCTSGMVLTSIALFDKGPATREEIARALSGNFCRCTGYAKILDALEDLSTAGKG